MGMMTGPDDLTAEQYEAAIGALANPGVPIREKSELKRALTVRVSEPSFYSRVYVAAVTDMYAADGQERDLSFLVSLDGELQWIRPDIRVLDDVLKVNNARSPSDLVGRVIRRTFTFQIASQGSGYFSPRYPYNHAVSRQIRQIEARAYDPDEGAEHFSIEPEEEDENADAANRIEPEGWDLDDTD